MSRHFLLRRNTSAYIFSPQTWNIFYRKSPLLYTKNKTGVAVLFIWTKVDQENEMIKSLLVTVSLCEVLHSNVGASPESIPAKTYRANFAPLLLIANHMKSRPAHVKQVPAVPTRRGHVLFDIKRLVHGSAKRSR